MIGPYCLVVVLSLLCCGVFQSSEATNCTSTADVVFILDSSGSIGATNWPHALTFVNNVVNNFVVNAYNGTMFGAVTYSQTAEVSFPLSGNKNYITITASRIPYQNSGTNTSGGFWVAEQQVLIAAAGDRTYAPDVIILVTDGQSNIDTSLTIPYATAAKKSGIAVIVVGVGDQVNMAEMKAIASVINGVTQVYLVADYPSITSTVQSDKISNVTCAVVVKPDCQNGGNAVWSADLQQYTCSCAAGFYGKLCENAKPNCQNGAQSVLQSDGSYKCSCPSGYYGDVCQNAEPKCQNGGNVVVASDGSHKCSCPSGYYGDLCEKAEPKCQNGGNVVVASDGSHKCSCASGYYGDLCDKAIPSCKNGGSAVLGSDGTYTCKCAPNFSGPTCDNAIPQCKNGGTSVTNADGTYTCKCQGNFYGPTCENVHCLNGGSYVNGKCSCAPDFYGDQCEKSPPPGYHVATDNNNQPVALVKAGTTPDSWDNLSKQCGASNAGATLAVVDTAAKDAAFKKYIQSLPSTASDSCGSQWAIAGMRNPVGVCDAKYNFVWKPAGKPSTPIVQGQSYTGWMYGQPDCSDSGDDKESCLAYWNDGYELGWNDYHCDENPACPLCELPL